MAEVALEIDGREVKVEQDTTILEAAKNVGIDIPTLCYHPALAPFGACRICSVEITSRGRSRIVTSCNYPVEEGLVVSTKSPNVIEIRKMLLELLLARAPKAEIIQDLAKEYGVEKTRFKIKDPENLCILCGLCARICEERMGVSVINFVNRGVERKVQTPFQRTSDADLDLCLACGACAFVCPTGAIKLEDITKKKPIPILSEFNVGLASRAPIYVPFPQAIPNVPVIDREKCVHFLTDKCKICEEFCPADAIDFEQEDEVIEVEVGAIIVATGVDVMDHTQFSIYGGGVYPDVISGLQLERMMSAVGPTGGEIIRPSNGAHPKEIVFVSCVGSRDERTGPGYCSKVCCMYMAKQAVMLKEHDPEVHSYILYTDARGPGGKIFEDFLHRAEKAGTTYMRGQIDSVSQQDGRLVVSGQDFLTSEAFNIPADLVVLATGMMPNEDVTRLFQTLHISYDAKNYLVQAHPKLRPVETAMDGIFIAGCAIAPTDIPETVAEGSAAASNVLTLFSQDAIDAEPMTSVVDVTKCTGCLLCQQVCPFQAVETETLRDGRTVSSINESVCKGCGICVAACRPGAIKLRGFSDQQILAEVMAL